ncbi:hypothetical protein SFC88_11260 [Nocardioides sp. HM23]|uniref:hypothetical protein n=1 Tax=Nocardioides bizhenqiangii TaxID=3095076 RepID=UPI002ACAE13F|nr:hypothetical protein [Nocardioides sp. HM23]MDZ5621411.1 hypothetical protein [Nocardioides sp. HM23]
MEGELGLPAGDSPGDLPGVGVGDLEVEDQVLPGDLTECSGPPDLEGVGVAELAGELGPASDGVFEVEGVGGVQGAGEVGGAVVADPVQTGVDVPVVPGLPAPSSDRPNNAESSITAKSLISGAPGPASGSPVSRPRSVNVATSAASSATVCSAAHSAISRTVAISCSAMTVRRCLMLASSSWDRVRTAGSATWSAAGAVRSKRGAVPRSMRPIQP